MVRPSSSWARRCPSLPVLWCWLPVVPALAVQARRLIRCPSSSAGGRVGARHCPSLLPVLLVLAARPLALSVAWLPVLCRCSSSLPVPWRCPSLLVAVRRLAARPLALPVPGSSLALVVGPRRLPVAARHCPSSILAARRSSLVPALVSLPVVVLAPVVPAQPVVRVDARHRLPARRSPSSSLARPSHLDPSHSHIQISRRRTRSSRQPAVWNF